MTPQATSAAPTPAAAVTSRPSHGSLLPAAMRSEWTKLRSVRSTVWSLVATFAITVGLGSLLCFAFVSRYDHLDVRERLTFDATAQSLRGLFLAQLAIGVLGVLIISSEYTTGLIRSTFASMPQRRTVLAGKVIVFGVVAAVVGTASVFVAFFTGQAILQSKHINVSLGDPHVLRAVFGAGAYLAIVGLLGLALATIFRRTAGAIATLFGLVLVFPLLARALPSPWNTNISKYLPSQLGAAMFSVRTDSDLLSPGVALIVVIAWLAAAFTLATILISRRDA